MVVKMDENSQVELAKLTQDMDPLLVDIYRLQKCDIAVRVEWAFSHMSQIMDGARMRMKEARDIDYVRLKDNSLYSPATILKMCPDEDTKNWAFMMKKRSHPHYHFWSVVFTAYRVLDCSCHQLYFGEHYASKISQTQEQFLKNMKAQSRANREAYMTELKDHEFPITCCWYLYKQRLEELTEDLGYSIEGILMAPFFTQKYHVKHRLEYIRLIDYLNQDLKPTKEENQNLGFIAHKPTSIGAEILTLLCFMYDLGVDRFLVQDYSRYAAHVSGEPLSAEEKRWLSAYLMADPETQTDVLADLESYM